MPRSKTNPNAASTSLDLESVRSLAAGWTERDGNAEAQVVSFFRGAGERLSVYYKAGDADAKHVKAPSARRDLDAAGLAKVFANPSEGQAAGGGGGDGGGGGGAAPRAPRARRGSKCFNCNGTDGHIAAECTVRPQHFSGCYMCGQEGHKRADCPSAQ